MHEGTMNETKNLPMLASTATRRQMIIGATSVFGCLTLAPAKAWPSGTDEISHTCEAIHQEIVFKASRKHVYDALTDAKQFNKVVLLSAAMQSGGMSPGSKPVEISPEVGGAFSAFGGYVSGRHIELLPNERIVQAWRAASWGPGQYSIARFMLTEQGSGTKLVFDHTGFPQGDGQHLAEGWRMNYWEPLEKYLAQG
jgi:activator of HSP90 ATPase